MIGVALYTDISLNWPVLDALQRKRFFLLIQFAELLFYSASPSTSVSNNFPHTDTEHGHGYGHMNTKITLLINSWTCWIAFYWHIADKRQKADHNNKFMRIFRLDEKKNKVFGVYFFFLLSNENWKTNDRKHKQTQSHMRHTCTKTNWRSLIVVNAAVKKRQEKK